MCSAKPLGVQDLKNADPWECWTPGVLVLRRAGPLGVLGPWECQTPGVLAPGGWLLGKRISPPSHCRVAAWAGHTQ